MSIGLIFKIAFWVLMAVLLLVNRKNIAAFAVAARAEMKKVIWPTRERVMAQTKVVLASLVVFSLFLGGIDLLLVKAMEWIFK